MTYFTESEVFKDFAKGINQVTRNYELKQGADSQPLKCKTVSLISKNHLAPVVRKVDNAIHRIVTFSTVVKMFEKL